jgi:transmembrane sensor
MMDKKKADEILNSFRVDFSRTPEESWSAIQNKIENRKGRVVPIRATRWWAAAASLALLVAVGVWMLSGPQSDIKTFLADTDNAPLRVELPDGSAVWLDAGAEVKYDAASFSKERHIDMSGIAHFEVEKSKVPFVVSTNRGTVRVLGTTFTVRSDVQMMEVNCFTGSVEVKNKKSETILTGGMTATMFSELSDIKLSRHDFAPFISGKTEFNYDEASLQDVMADIERIYRITIELNVSDEKKFTGHFHSGLTSEQALTIVCKSMGMKFEQTGDRVVVTEKRD